MHRLIPHLKNKKLVIFDYNGTILYDLDLCVEALNTLMTRQNLQPISVETYRATFYFPVKSFYEHMGFDFSKVSFEEISRQYYEIYNDNLHRCGVFEGLIDLLLELKENKIKTAILTALNQQELYRQIPMFGLEGLFDEAFGLADFAAHSKVERGRDLMQHMAMDPKDCILVGDTIHDAEVAHDLGIDILLLDDGHQTKDRLDDHLEKKPTLVQSSVVSLQRKLGKKT